MKFKPQKNKQTRFSKRRMPSFEMPKLTREKREKREKPKAEKVKAPKQKQAKAVTGKAKSFSHSKTRFQIPQFKSKLVLPILVAVLAALIVTGVVFAAVSVTTAHNNAVVGIAVTKMPDKQVYFVGQEADYTGLEITATKRNGETLVVPLSACEITGFSSDYAVKERVLLVQYEGCATLFSVEVCERAVIVKLLGVSLYKEPRKTTYAPGEEIDLGGATIKVEYENAIPKYINPLNEWATIEGDVITITYVDYELNQSATCTFPITVTE